MVTSARIAGIRALAGLITTILLPIPAFAQPKIIFIGDSITRGGGAANPATNGFVGQLSERFPELLVACNCSLCFSDFVSSAFCIGGSFY